MDFAHSKFNRPTRFFPEGTEPSGRIVAPGAHENSLVDDNHPDTCVAVLSSGANADNLRLLQRFDDGTRE